MRTPIAGAAAAESAAAAEPGDVVVRGDRQAAVRGARSVTAFDRSRVVATDCETVAAYDESEVIAVGCGSVAAFDDSRVAVHSRPG
jgi:hypothetical protein